MKRSVCLLGMLYVLPAALLWAEDKCDVTGRRPVSLAKPSREQVAFADMEVGAFIHYGLNVYTGQDHGDGKNPASKFNPTHLDAEQWVLAAKALGAKYAVLTARHEGGFCLWPTKTTDYSIVNSPYKDGKGDIVKDFVEACRKHDIKPCLYHTAYHDARHIFQAEDNVRWGKVWDKISQKRFAEMDMEEYTRVQLGQLTELLTQYGPITYLWFDHWGCAGLGAKELWTKVTKTVRQLQPDCLMLGPDVWLPGNESGRVVYPMWNPVNTADGTVYTRPIATMKGKGPDQDGLLETDVNTGDPYGKFWRLRECPTTNAFSRHRWFWHGPRDPLSLERRMDLYYRTVGLGANVIINLPPDNRGLVPDDLIAAANEMRREIERRLGTPVAQTSGCGKTVTLAWPGAKTIDHIVLMENIVNGQKVAEYVIEATIDGQWKRIVNGRTIGHKKIDRIKPITTNAVRFRCLKAIEGPAEIRSFAVYGAR